MLSQSWTDHQLLFTADYTDCSCWYQRHLSTCRPHTHNGSALRWGHVIMWEAKTIKKLHINKWTEHGFHHCSFVGHKKRNTEAQSEDQRWSQSVIITVENPGMNVALLCCSTLQLLLKPVCSLPAAAILTCFPWGNPNCRINESLVWLFNLHVAASFKCPHLGNYPPVTRNVV